MQLLLQSASLSAGPPSVSFEASRAFPGPLIILHQLLLHVMHDGLWVGMKTFAKAITSRSIPRLTEARP